MDIKGCPFCGGSIRISPNLNAHPVYFVCKDCRVVVYWDLPFPEALENWNEPREGEEFYE